MIMIIVVEEIFSIVMMIISFKTIDEVIARANGQNLFSLVLYKQVIVHRVIDTIDVGATWINNYNLALGSNPQMKSMEECLLRLQMQQSVRFY